MPTVPATPVSRTRQQILGAPARIGTIDDLSGLGSAISGLEQTVTGEITAHMQRLKTEADENEAILAQSQYLDTMNAAHYDGESAFLNRKGNAARNSFSDGRDFANAQLESIAKSLSPDASKLFKRAANQTRANFGTQLIKHVGAQTEQARVEALAASQASLQEAFTKSRDPEEREEIATALDAVLDRQSVGSTPEAKQVMNDFSDGKITGEAAVNALNRGDIEDAKTILASDRGKHIEESTRIKVQNGIDESEHLTAVQGTVQEALVRFSDPTKAEDAEAWIKRNSSGAVQGDSITNIRKFRSAEATAETAQRKAENEAAHSFTDDILEQQKRGGAQMDTKSAIAMGQQLASRIEDHTKRNSFQRRWDDEVTNHFATVTNQSQYSQLDNMTWQEMQDVDLREAVLEREDYQKLLKKQNTTPSNHTNLTSMMSNAIFDLGLDPSSTQAFNLRQNFKHDIEVLEKKVGPLSQSELDDVMQKLKENSKDTNFWFWQDDTDISLQSISKQFQEIPDQDIEVVRDQLARTLGKRREDIQEREIVSAYRLFLNQQAIGLGRIAEPQTTQQQEQEQ